MAKTKKQPPDQKATGNGASISKVDAMRAALETLWLDATNKNLEGHIRSNFGPQAVPGNFSVTKSAVMKKLRGSDGGKAAAPAAAASAPAPAAPPRPAAAS